MKKDFRNLDHYGHKRVFGLVRKNDFAETILRNLILDIFKMSINVQRPKSDNQKSRKIG